MIQGHGDFRELKKARVRPEEARVVERRMREEAAVIGEEIERIEETESARRPLESIEVGARAYVKPLDRDGVVLSQVTAGEGSRSSSEP